MTVRIPLVVIGGMTQEVPAGDVLPPSIIMTLAQLADGTAAGGNARGTGAVDWQSARTAATQVASGNYSVICGGQANTASGANAAVAGGVTNTASGGTSTVAGGTGNTASASWSTVVGGSTNTASFLRSVVVGGANNTASANGAAVVGGSSNTASGTSAAVVGGTSNTADGNFSLASGANAHTRGCQGAFAHASGQFAAVGDAQTREFVLRNALVGVNSNIPLLADGTTDIAARQVALPVDSTFMFEAYVVARRADADNESAAWLIRGAVDCGATASTVRLVGTPSVTELARDAVLGASVSVSVDASTGVLRILATVSDSGKTIRFVAKVTTVEVVG